MNTNIPRGQYLTWKGRLPSSLQIQYGLVFKNNLQIHDYYVLYLILSVDICCTSVHGFVASQFDVISYR